MKIVHTALGVCDTYEVVTEPPLGYIIWNIGTGRLSPVLQTQIYAAV